MSARHEKVQCAWCGSDQDILPTTVTRFEVIDKTGRVLSQRDIKVELSYQDTGRTLKVFLSPRETGDTK